MSSFSGAPSCTQYLDTTACLVEYCGTLPFSVLDLIQDILSLFFSFFLFFFFCDNQESLFYWNKLGETSKDSTNQARDQPYSQQSYFKLPMLWKMYVISQKDTKFCSLNSPSTIVQEVSTSPIWLTFPLNSIKTQVTMFFRKFTLYIWN